METDGARKHCGDKREVEVTVTPPAPPTNILPRLHSDLRALARRQISRAHFEWLWPDTQAQRWQEQRRHTLPQTSAYLDLTCLLAYYGVDYVANVERLREPYARFRQNPQVLRTQETWECLHALPILLGLVYGKQRDAKLLHLLL